MGGWIRDVFVYHKVYGVIRADMNIHSRRDIRKYLEEIANGKSSLLMKCDIRISLSYNCCG